MHVVPIYGWGWSGGFGFNIPGPFELDAEVQEVPFRSAVARIGGPHPLQGMFVVLTPLPAIENWKFCNLSAYSGGAPALLDLEWVVTHADVQGFARVTPLETNSVGNTETEAFKKVDRKGPEIIGRVRFLKDVVARPSGYFVQVAMIGVEHFSAYVVLEPNARKEAGDVIEAPVGFLRPDFVVPLLEIGMKFPLHATHEQVFAEVEVLEVTVDGKRFQATDGRST